jgi:asparagine synthetase B (glutamine-hydrolysing)
MPGLFGAISLSVTGVHDSQRVGDNLARMQRKLTHEDYYSAREWRVADRGIDVRQLGLSSLFGEYHDVELGVSGRYYGTLQHDGAQTRWPESLNGFFSLACLDDRHDCSWLVADRRSAEPIYYTEVSGVLYFAPEAKALIEIPGVAKSTDLAAMGALLACGHLYNHQSLFADVHRLPGGHALRIQNGRIALFEYWRFQPGERGGDLSPQELRAELGDRVTDSVRRHLGDDNRAVIFLSGGYDSRGILGAALEAVNGDASRLHTASWGLDENVAGTDAHVAGTIARDLGINHLFMERNSEGYGEHFARSNYLIDAQSDVAANHPQEFEFMAQLRRRGFDRVIRGDEAFGWGSRAYSLVGAFARVGLKPLSGIEGLRGYFQPDYYSRLADANHEEHSRYWRQCDSMEPNTAKDFLYFNHRVQTYLASASYFKQVLHDHRNPLIDDALLDLLGTIPSALRINKNLFTDMSRSRYPTLAQYPYAVHSGEEDWEQILSTPSPFRTYVTAQLADRRSGVWQIFNHQAISQLVDSAAVVPHQSSWKARTRKLVVGAGRTALRKLAPAATDSLQGARFLRRELDKASVVMRFLVVKNWHDTFH